MKVKECPYKSATWPDVFQVTWKLAPVVGFEGRWLWVDHHAEAPVAIETASYLPRQTEQRMKAVGEILSYRSLLPVI
jgi:hypothetical protein